MPLQSSPTPSAMTSTLLILMHLGQAHPPRCSWLPSRRFGNTGPPPPLSPLHWSLSVCMCSIRTAINLVRELDPLANYKLRARTSHHGYLPISRYMRRCAEEGALLFMPRTDFKCTCQASNNTSDAWSPAGFAASTIVCTYKCILTSSTDWNQLANRALEHIIGAGIGNGRQC